MDKPSLLAHKEFRFFASVMIRISRLVQIFCFDCLVVLCYISKYQVFPINIKVYLIIYISLRGQYGTTY